MINTDYCLERRLSILDAKLHRRYKECVLKSQTMLTRYQSVFPRYTDHPLLHTMNVTDFCGRLIGAQMAWLSADDISVLLMGCLFHDVSMGISPKDYECFKLRLGLEHLTAPLSERAHAEIIRNYQPCTWRSIGRNWMSPTRHIQPPTR